MLVWVVALGCLATTARAQADCARIRASLDEQGAQPGPRVQVLALNGCLGGASDTGELAVAVRKVVPASYEDQGAVMLPDDILTRTERALDILEGSLRADLGTAPEDARDEIAALDAALRETRRTVASAGICLPTKIVPPVAAPAHYEFDVNALTIGDVPGTALSGGILAPTCDRGSPETCRDGLRAVESLVRVATLAESVLVFYTGCYIDEADAQARLLDRKWTAYFDEARSQYPWELAFNGWRIARRDRRAVVDGNRVGFLDPPAYQWIVLHPTVAFEYVNDAPDGQQLEPAVLVELLGYNRWSYRDDGSMGGALGVSLITVVADRAGVDDVGYGLALHVNHKLSLGVTRRDSETGYLVSGDLSQLWLKARSKWRNRLSGR